ncbi:MAG: hypothetical protein H6883_07890 [Rhodobiaceae bacterium]|nr:hypothetical protein [Rhodobiaceae bacterium]MCC0056042.1 hypothetical protein [Rhodobiaceae bacterium]
MTMDELQVRFETLSYGETGFVNLGIVTAAIALGILSSVSGRPVSRSGYTFRWGIAFFALGLATFICQTALLLNYSDDRWQFVAWQIAFCALYGLVLGSVSARRARNVIGEPGLAWSALIPIVGPLGLLSAEARRVRDDSGVMYGTYKAGIAGLGTVALVIGWVLLAGAHIPPVLKGTVMSLPKLFIPVGLQLRPYRFKSDDMRPVRVNFVGKRRELPEKTFAIPRAYVEYAEDYYTDTYWRLPDTIETHSLRIKARFSGYPETRARYHEVPLDGYKPGDWENSIRADQFSLQLSRFELTDQIKQNIERTWNRGTLYRQFDAVMNTYAYARGEKSTQVTYQGRDPTDEFKYVNCGTSNLKHPYNYCTYYFFMSRNISARASFLQPRSHGGLTFINQRIRLIRRQLCPYLECEGVDVKGHFTAWPEREGHAAWRPFKPEIQPFHGGNRK